jgi:hypothetical protein
MRDDQKKKTSLPSVFERTAAESTEPWIKAFLLEKTGFGRVDVQKIFRAAAIEEITSVPRKEGVSRLHLYNGKIIPVKMEADALWQKIYKPDFRSSSEPISLLEVTGGKAFPPPPIPDIGEMVEDEGIYIGQYTRLSKTFNVFAAPEDLPGERSQSDTLKLVNSLTNWHGYDGTGYSSDSVFYAALDTGSYSGNWVVPPIDILRDHFYSNKDKDALRDSIKIAAPDKQPTYYSSTPDGKEYFMVMQFADGKANNGFRDTAFPCRPVRLVEFKP